MGEYMCMDKNKRYRNTYQAVRFCANIDISNPMKMNIYLKNKRGEHIQEISFDISPIIYVACNKYEHVEKDFLRRNRQQNQQGPRPNQ